jgi:hypothetical protein
MNPLIDEVWDRIIRERYEAPGLPGEIVNRYLTAVYSGKRPDDKSTLAAVLAEYAEEQIATALDLQRRAAAELEQARREKREQEARRVEAERQARERAEQEARDAAEQAARQAAEAERGRLAAARAAWPVIAPADMLSSGRTFRYIPPAERGPAGAGANVLRLLLVARGLMLKGDAQPIIAFIGGEQDALRIVRQAAALVSADARDAYDLDEAREARAGAFLIVGEGGSWVKEVKGRLVVADRQCIVQLFPTAHRSASVTWDRQRIAWD